MQFWTSKERFCMQGLDPYCFTFQHPPWALLLSTNLWFAGNNRVFVTHRLARVLLGNRPTYRPPSPAANPPNIVQWKTLNGILFQTCIYQILDSLNQYLSCELNKSVHSTVEFHICLHLFHCHMSSRIVEM